MGYRPGTLDPKAYAMELQARAAAQGILPPNIFQEVPDTQFFAQDELVQAEAWRDPDLKPATPLYSPMMRTSNLKRKDAKILNLRIAGIMARIEALAYDDLFDVRDSTKFEAHEMYLQVGINDSVNGWRLKALIERIRTSVVRMENSGSWTDKLRRRPQR